MNEHAACVGLILIFIVYILVLTTALVHIDRKKKRLEGENERMEDFFHDVRNDMAALNKDVRDFATERYNG